LVIGWSKVGLQTLPGAQYAGRIEVVDIGIAPEHGVSIQTELMTASWARSVLPERPPDAHKGTFGSALIVAGSPQYVGAAALSCTGALRVGPGIVTLACARSVYPMLATKLSETTFEPLDDKDGFLSAEEAYTVRRTLSWVRCSARRPWLGQGAYVVAFMRALLPMLAQFHRGQAQPDTDGGADLRAVVLDADGLNNIARVDRWWDMLSVPAVITPHPGEPHDSRRRDHGDTGRPPRRRPESARRNGTHRRPQGREHDRRRPGWPRPPQSLRQPRPRHRRTGDVLAGAITGLIARGVDPFEASSSASISTAPLANWCGAQLGTPACWRATWRRRCRGRSRRCDRTNPHLRAFVPSWFNPASLSTN
jgi:NAD(P)H-hydrate epimerase